MRARFFTPSYLTRPSSTSSTSNGLHFLALADSLNSRATTSRAISFSSNNSSSSSRSGPNNNNNNNNRLNRVAVATAGRVNAVAVAAADAGKDASASSPSSSSSGAAAGSSSGSSSTVSASVVPIKKLTPLAPTLAHANDELIRVDSFFAVHRPLLELPIRLQSRRSVTPTTTSVEQRLAEVQGSAFSAAGGVASTVHTGAKHLSTAEGEELVEVVDLDADGTPTGPSYMATLSSALSGSSSSSSSSAAASAMERIEMAEADDAQLEQLANEAAEADFEDGVSPYEQWLIGETDPGVYTPKVARYLAAMQPFVPPPPPPSAASPILPSATAPPPLSPKTLADLSFLRPFPATSARSAPLDEFTKQFLDPLSASEATQIADTFLSSALLTHRWTAMDSFARNGGEKLELALNQYKGTSNVLRRPWEEKRKPGEVRLWDDEKGWVTVEMGGGEGGLFMPAEMVDLDWVDEQYEIQLDSTKRKRKKKITKHKYKKRRKAQKALRQRLGK